MAQLIIRQSANEYKSSVTQLIGVNFTGRHLKGVTTTASIRVATTRTLFSTAIRYHFFGGQLVFDEKLENKICMAYRGLNGTEF